MTDAEDRDYQADVCRALAYYLNAPLSEGCRLLGVLPKAGAVRVAVRAGDDETGMSLLYEIPLSAVAPGMVPAFVRSLLSGPQFYSSSDMDEVMGMTLIRLRPDKIGTVEELEGDLALAVLRSLAAPVVEAGEDPFLIGFLLRGGGGCDAPVRSLRCAARDHRGGHQSERPTDGAGRFDSFPAAGRAIHEAGRRGSALRGIDGSDRLVGAGARNTT
ncbi:hypothetical protein [Streptomyces sp. NPDC001340]